MLPESPPWLSNQIWQTIAALNREDLHLFSAPIDYTLRFFHLSVKLMFSFYPFSWNPKKNQCNNKYSGNSNHFTWNVTHSKTLIEDSHKSRWVYPQDKHQFKKLPFSLRPNGTVTWTTVLVIMGLFWRKSILSIPASLHPEVTPFHWNF